MRSASTLVMRAVALLPALLPALLVVALPPALLAGCSAEIPEGRYHCATDVECPDGWSCSGGLCWSSPSDAGAGVDATGDDAGPAEDGGAGTDAAAPIDGGGCEPDPGEPNEGPAAAEAAGPLAIGSSRGLSSYNLHDAVDQDWIAFTVMEGGAVGSGLRATVTLASEPPGSDLDLAAFFECNGLGEKSVSCSDGEASGAFGDGGCVSATHDDTTETVALDISCGAVLPRGTLYVRVTSFFWGGSCDPYVLTLDLQER